MNIIPSFIVQTINTLVSVDRINSFLDEEEVPVFVSAIKEHDERPEGTGEASGILDQRLGIEHGNFQWNKTKENPNSKGKAAGPWWKIWKKNAPAPKKPASDSSTSGNGADGASENASLTRFELRDIKIFFPIGKLTVVTGPTG